jgi:hypothetical protein
MEQAGESWPDETVTRRVSKKKPPPLADTSGYEQRIGIV